MLLTLDSVNEALAANAAEAKTLSARRNEILASTIVLCDSKTGGCGMGFRVKDVTYIQSHCYVPPSGCIGGDYWRMGAGNWECPSCRKVHRLHDEPSLVALKHLFKEIVDEHV